MPPRGWGWPSASAAPRAPARLQSFLDQVLDLGAGDRPHHLTDDLPFLEDQQRRDAADVELAGHARVGVDVALADPNLALVLLGQGLDVGGDGPARGAPGGPEV